MKLDYRNIKEDHSVFVECIWFDRRDRFRDDWLSSRLFWFGIIFCAAYIGFESDQIFGASLMVAFGISMFWRKYWWESDWSSQVEQAASAIPEVDVELEISESGVIERSRGITLFVPWGEITKYSTFRDRVVVFFLKSRGFIVPSRDVGCEALAELAKILENRNIPRSEMPNK